jgi:hypothetical protein
MNIIYKGEWNFKKDHPQVKYMILFKKFLI